MTVTKTHIMSDETGQDIVTALESLVNAQAPTKTSDLTNDSGFQTASQVQATVEGYGYQTESQMSTAISTALGSITQVAFSVVASLPATGTAGTLYLVANGGSGTNRYDEYADVDGQGTWEKLGERTLDLSGYAQTSSLSQVATSGSYSDLTNKPSAMTASDLSDGTSTTPMVVSPKVLADYVADLLDAADEEVANGSY